MARQLKYVVAWIATVILFNLICFLTPIGVGDTGGHSGGFWAGYGFLMTAFVLHLVFSYFALSERNKEKKVLNTPLIIISSAELCLMVIVGIVCMAVTAIPYWLGIIICYAFLLLSIIFFITAKAVSENAQVANKVLNNKTRYFRELIDLAQELLSVSKTVEVKQISQKVYDTIRYSDLVSYDQTVDDEMIICSKLETLINQVRDNDEVGNIERSADELVLLVEKRNHKCRESKRQV